MNTHVHFRIRVQCRTTETMIGGSLSESGVGGRGNMWAVNSDMAMYYVVSRKFDEGRTHDR